MCAVQVTHLFSADATTFLKPQSDGNLVLYNTERYSTYGASRAAAVWASNTYLTTTAPYNLVMQPVSSLCCSARARALRMHTNNRAWQSLPAWALHQCSFCRRTLPARRVTTPHASAMQNCDLVLYKASGTAPADVIYSSGTSSKGAPPCQLTISSAGGGFIAVSDSKFVQLYSAPTPALVRQPSPCAQMCCIQHS
jgi:hypothetical protein